MSHKRAQRVQVYVEHYQASRHIYTCPSCKSNNIDYALHGNVTRIMCSCGQELILERTSVPPSKAASDPMSRSVLRVSTT